LAAPKPSWLQPGTIEADDITFVAGKPVLARRRSGARRDGARSGSAWIPSGKPDAGVRQDVAKFPRKRLIFINNFDVIKGWQIKSSSMKILHNF
jgi:hypothetical protein